MTPAGSFGWQIDDNYDNKLDITNIKVTILYTATLYISNTNQETVMNFKSNLSLRHSVLTVSRNSKVSRREQKTYNIMDVNNHLFDMVNNFFEPSFTLWFQDIKIPFLLGDGVSNKVGMRDKTQWSGMVACRNILIDT